MYVAFFFIAQIFPILLLLFVIYFLLRPLINGAVYFPTTPRNVETIVTMAGVRPGQRAADLGSGDGRIVIALARAGAEVHGYEVNPLLVWKSRRAIKRTGIGHKAFIHWKSFWRRDLSSFDVVVVYGIPYIMKKLGDKLHRELKPGALIISNIYEFPQWSPLYSENRVYLYNKEYLWYTALQQGGSRR